MRLDEPHRLRRQKGAAARQQRVDGISDMGDVCGQRCEEEQKREQRKDEVITERGRVVGHPVVLVLLVEALEKTSSVQLHTPRQF